MKTQELSNIKTLSQFADVINTADEWKLEFNAMIEANGWTDDTDSTYGICNDGSEKLEFDESGEAVILPIA